MKKILYFFMMLLSASFMNVQANCYFTIDDAVNDTVHVSPLLLDNAVNLTIRAHFDGRLDYWHLTMTYPSGLSYLQKSEGDSVLSGLYIPFVNRWGHDSIYHAEISVLQNGNEFTSSIVENGYWDPNGDGNYDTYGTIKWEAGDYPCMFKLLLHIGSTFHYGTLNIVSLLSSTYDWRGGTIQPGEMSYKNIVIHVGYRRGDVNGDGYLNINDVALLNSYLLGQVVLDVYQLEAADMNGDGLVNIADVTALVNRLLQNGAINAHDLEELF